MAFGVIRVPGTSALPQLNTFLQDRADWTECGLDGADRKFLLGRR
jgi:hypothetical protein